MLRESRVVHGRERDAESTAVIRGVNQAGHGLHLARSTAFEMDIAESTVEAKPTAEG